MADLAALLAAQAATAQAVTDLAARVAALPAPTPPVDLQAAVDAELAMQASLSQIAPAPAA